MKRILVSNDDSISANGVRALIDRLTRFGEVTAVCPDSPCSGKSMALTVNDALKIVRLEDYNGARMFKVNGTPVDCVKLAMHTIMGGDVDLVVAGINHGSNSSINVLYSGTMGAAMEGCAFGIPSIGFSLTDHSPDADFTPCHATVDLLVEKVLEEGLPTGVCLNVNVPANCGIPKEMRVVRGCRGNWSDEYKEYLDPYGQKFYWLTGKFTNEEPDSKDTDEWCLSHGIVSVVPVMLERSVNRSEIPWLQEKYPL